jgi:hypothetical protein
MFIRLYILLAMLAICQVGSAQTVAWAVKAQSVSPNTRAFSLADLGVVDSVSMSDRGDSHEQHFYFSIPQQARLKDARIDLRAVFSRSFADDAALSFSLNGVPLSKLILNANEDSYSRVVPSDDAPVKALSGTRPAKEIVLSIPITSIDSKKGFVDFSIVLNSRTTQNVRDHSARNVLFIDPQATGLVYTFEPESVNDVRTALATLPRHPVILLPQSDLTHTQYEAALRVALALGQKDLRAEFVSIPKLGDEVKTSSLSVPEALQTSPFFSDFFAAAAQKKTLKITSQPQIGAWLLLRSWSAQGLAHIVIDAQATAKIMRAALSSIKDVELPNRFLAIRQLDIPDATVKANIRVAPVAGQPVLLLDEPNMAAAAGMLTTTWLALATSQDQLLDKAALFTNAEQDKTHFYFPQNQAVKDVENKAEWIIPFKLSELPLGKWPEAFEVNLLSAPTGDRVQSIVSVYLNDNLLISDFMRSDGQLERITARIPQYSIAASNYLRVEIRRRCDGNECTEDRQSYPAQMLPSSYLQLAEQGGFQQFFMLPPTLAHEAEVILPAKYLQNPQQSLDFVHDILSGLSARSQGIVLRFTDQPTFKPQRTFVAFEIRPEHAAGLVSSNKGQLKIHNAEGAVVFDAAGFGSMATLQLLNSGEKAGVYVAPVADHFPRFSEPLLISEGDFAVVDEHGIRLELNLADPGNQLQLDKQNRDTGFFISRNRGWLLALGGILLIILSLFGLRKFLHRGLNKGAVKNAY